MINVFKSNSYYKTSIDVRRERYDSLKESYDSLKESYDSLRERYDSLKYTPSNERFRIVLPGVSVSARPAATVTPDSTVDLNHQPIFTGHQGYSLEPI